MYVPWLFLTIRARMFTQFYIFYKRNWTDGFQVETRFARQILQWTLFYKSLANARESASDS